MCAPATVPMTFVRFVGSRTFRQPAFDPGRQTFILHDAGERPISPYSNLIAMTP